MGFGKTTAVNWWVKQRGRTFPDTIFVRQMIDTPSISDFWDGVYIASELAYYSVLQWGILLESLDADTSLSDANKRNYLGECELVMSFLKFIDISAMSEYHRRARPRKRRNARMYALLTIAL